MTEFMSKHVEKQSSISHGLAENSCWCADLHPS